MAIRFAMCNEFCEGWDFASACHLAAETGYEGIEIAPFTIRDSVRDISAQQRTELKRTADEHGLEVVGLHWLLVKPEGLYMNHPDVALRERTAGYLEAEIAFCADLGGKVMVVGSPKQRNVLEGDTYEATWDRTVKVFQELAPSAASRGVCLCIEPLSPQETNFINTAEDGRRLVEAVDHPAFRLILDVKAMSSEHEPIADIIRNSAPCLRHFHANDANLLGPGFGDTDFRPIAAALREVGYDGFVSVEVFDFTPGAEKIAGDSLRYLREVFAQ